MGYAVRFEEVTKRYPRGGPRYASLRLEIADGLRALGRRRRAGQPEPRGTRALDRISFKVEEGEAFAIIGPNGAGKTTALKLISRISYPTSGRVRVRGQVGALIEVGSGVHPELTGRENIWLYGQILGMSRADIRRRFDEIVEFAELAHALDTPVKMYSTGMQLRLGFAIASHLDPDVFVVDEALAVGDAGFQARCVKRMTKLVAEGRTLLFVSHNLYAVETLCQRGLYLEQGRILGEGPVRKCLALYLTQVANHVADGYTEHGLSCDPRLRLRVHCLGPDGAPRLQTGHDLKIVCEYECSEPGIEVLIHYGMTDGRAGNLLLASQVVEGGGPVVLSSRGCVICTVPRLPLMPRVYEVWGEVRLGNGWGNLVDWQPLGTFVVEYGPGSGASVSHASMDGPIRQEVTFVHKRMS
jgi:ABC-type polysaccharide/polyol phosphate transport system ATPase subunit